MGLAATPTDAANLYTWTTYANGAGHGCTFGCHAFVGVNNNDDGAAASGSPNSASQYNYPNDQIAKLSGVSLRIDSLRTAASDMVSTALANEGSQQLYRFALYRIGQTTSTIAPLSTDLNGTLSKISGLTLGPNVAGGVGDTNLKDMTNYVRPYITAHGDGTTQANARAFLFIVTDGVSDVAGSCTDGHCTSPIDPTTCDQYKALNPNFIVGIVYTTYLPIYTPPSSGNLDVRYQQLVKQFSTPGYNSLSNAADNSLDIAPALQKCASPGWFYTASDGPGIQAAMSKLFTQATQAPVITH